MEYKKKWNCPRCKYSWQTIEDHWKGNCPKCGFRTIWGEWGDPITGKGQTSIDEWARGSRPIRNTKDGSPPLGGELSD